MRKRSRRSSHAIRQPDINLNSFLDLILNILLFFVFATELAIYDAINVSVPVSESAETLSTDQQTVIIFITKDNQLLADGEHVESDNLAAWLLQKKKADTSFNNVVVRGDLNSSLQTMVNVLSACKVADIDKVKIETEKPSA
jgi:biopolymer transport protein ExbD